MGRAILARRGGALCAALALAAMALLCGPSPASANLEFCPQGEGAGQCAAAQRIGAQRGLAVDAESGRLYVADEANNRVNVFEIGGDFLFAFGWKVNATTPEEKLQTCTTTTGCQKGTAGSGPGQLDRPTEVTADNDPASPSQHAIYVSELGEDEGIGKDREHPRVQKFDPAGEFIWMAGEEVDKTDNSDLCAKAEGHTCGRAAKSSAEGGFSSAFFIDTGPAGVLYAVDNVRPSGNLIKRRLQRFEPSGALIPPEVILLEGDLMFARGMVVDAAGDIWVTGLGLRKHSLGGALLAGPIESEVSMSELAIDTSGDIYVAQSEPRDKGLGSFNVLAAYHPAGNLFRRFAYTEFGSGNAINGLTAHTSAFGEFFFSQTNEGITYVFQPTPGPLPAPPSLEAKDIGSAKATLLAEVNSEGKATEVHFEHLTQAEWEAQGESFAGPATQETPTEALGATGFNLKTTEALAGCPDPGSEAELPESPCLIPETTYRWRIVATNADNPTGEGESSAEGLPFTTEESPEIGEIWATRVGTDTARLRGEVNPNSIPATGFFEYVDDAAYQKDVGKGGDGFAAATKAPDVDAGEAPLDFGTGEALITRQVTIDPLDPGTLYHYRLTAENPLLSEPKLGQAEELRTFSPPEVDPSCSNDAARIGPGAFLPDCRAYEMVSPLDKEGGDIRLLTTSVGELAVLEQSSLSGERLAYGSSRSFGGAASAPYTSQYIARRIAGVEWETHPINSPRGRPLVGFVSQLKTEFKAFSADLCETWQRTFAEPPLAEGAQAGSPNLYRRTDELCAEDGEAHYEALAPGAGLWGLSADGEHAVLATTEELLPEGTAGQSQLYEHARGVGLRFVCFLPGGEAVSGTCAAGSATAAAEPGAQVGRVSDDGERIFWSAAATGEGKIYVRIGGAQTVAVSKEGEEESGTSNSWFWGAASDGSAAIFSTSKAGSSDLYRFDVDSEATELIAAGVLGVMGISEDATRVYFASDKVLSEEANGNGDKAQAGKANLYLREGDGSTRFIATLANNDLSQAVSNEPYRKRTSQVSPDGGHATFVSAAPLTGYDNIGAESGAPAPQVFRYDAAAGELACVSCNPSGARPASSSSIPFWQTGMHAARVLSADGSRLYFESADALAARDSNGRTDVYQWEEPGAGGCDEADAGFSPASGGCVELVSSGQSPQNSRFVEASPSGEDVFFATVASLLPQDFGVFDIYDARVGGGLPIPPPKEPPCEGDACAAQVPVPEEPTPASSEYVAPPTAADESKPARRRCAKGKRRVQRKGKSRCVAKQKRQRRAR